MPFILAHDLGTTSNKATLFDSQGNLVASHLQTYVVAYPQPGWAEQNPADWWRAICSASQAILSEAGVAAKEIAAVTFSGQIDGHRSD